jgi:dTDP-4-amino-4,6-dideoxygalactose transaminase
LTDAYLAQLRADSLPAERAPQPTWGRFPVDVGKRDGERVQRRLWEKHRIRTTQMYERPWFDYPRLRDAALDYDDPVWARLRGLLRRTVCVPFHPAMTEADVARVAAALNR